MQNILFNNSVFEEHKDNPLALKWRNLAKFSRINLGHPNAHYRTDRSGTIPHFLDLKQTSPLPEHWHAPASFADICLNQASKLTSLGYPQTVFWSGGVDSTLIVIALLMIGSNDPDFLNIACTHKSIEEYPWFYRFLKQKGIKIHVGFTDSIYQYSGITGKENLLTGHLADYIFHCGNICIRNDNCDWKDFYPKDIVEFIEPLVDICPKKITKLYDVAWWLRFTMHWQDAKYAPYTSLKAKPRSIINFFDSPQWEEWSLENHGNDFAQTDPLLYKPEAKKFIIEYTGDKDYWNKMKIPSLKVKRNLKSWQYLNENCDLTGEGSWDIAW